jgi:hypothetical protein
MSGATRRTAAHPTIWSTVPPRGAPHASCQTGRAYCGTALAAIVALLWIGVLSTVTAFVL